MNPLLILSKDSLTHGIWTYLLRGRGYRVIEATLDELGKEDAPIPFEPALIIYDFHPATPLTEGLDSLEMLADLCPGIPLVLLLPASWPSAHKKMFQEYASGYLTKPVDYAALIRLVDLLLAKARTAPAPPLPALGLSTA